MATYDLLLKGGHVLDPGRGLDGIYDIGVAGGVIAAIDPDLPETEAATVLRVGDPHRYVVPGLVDIHTHVAHGATTRGVGMQCCDPDAIGVHSGVTTVVDCGSVGVANVGTFPVHIVPRARTRVLCYINAGTFAHTTPRFADIGSLDEVDEAAIAGCIEANPGLVSGIKLRLVGPIMVEQGEEVINRSLSAARRHQIPLMVHIGDPRAGEGGHPDRVAELTRFLLRNFQEGDILTHLCTPHVGGVMNAARQPVPELAEARSNGVVLDSALGMGNFGYEVAREQAQLGVQPDSISSDLTAMGQTFHSLMECMAKFMAVGYTLSDVVRMTTAQAAQAIGLADQLGALEVGREADVTVLDVVEGDFVFRDTTRQEFRGSVGIVPVQTVRAGELFAPRWGTHPWGWLPESAA